MRMRQIVSAASFYPMTGLYVGGVILAMLAVTHSLEWPFCLIVFGLLFMSMLLIAANRELKQVHSLVDGQKTEMLMRIDHLTELLVKSERRIGALTDVLIERGITIPDDQVDQDEKNERDEAIQHPHSEQVGASR